MHTSVLGREPFILYHAVLSMASFAYFIPLLSCRPTKECLMAVYM